VTDQRSLLHWTVGCGRWALGVEKRRSIAALAPRCRLRAGSQKLALAADPL